MPELPEVQTVVDGLREHIRNQVIESVWVGSLNLRKPIQQDLAAQLQGQVIQNIYRRAKYIIIQLEVDLIVHLAMSGRLLLEAPNYEKIKHDHIVIKLGNGNQLVYHDHRRFGMFFWHPNAERYLSGYGIEPLLPNFDATHLYQMTRTKMKSIKGLIMDQKFIVGVGNIYACEALFHAKISPLKLSKDLTQLDCETLVNSIKVILNRAIKEGGTTLKDYRQSNNDLGYFQQRLLVYGRAGKACEGCGTAITVIRQSGRSTFYCESCQA